MPTIRADIDHAEARRRRRWAAVWLGVGLSLALAVGLTLFWIWRLVFADLPPTPPKAQLVALNRPPSLVFLDREGVEIGRRGRAADIALGQLPPYVPRAFLAAEDRRFYSHFGVDPVGVARALRADLKARRIVEGGSTITQQIARTLLLTPEQTLKRKLQEAALAVIIERRMSKDEILALYLNRIYFGAGAYGIEAAARTYFGKPAARLTLSEAALLAALPKAPTRLDPTNDFAAALARSRLVLARMRASRWITPEEETRARAAPPQLARESAADADFGHVLDLAAPRARELAPANTDLIVTLAIDSRLQKLAAAAVRQAVAEGRARGATEAAMAALAPGGAIRALVGGVDHRDSAFDRAVQARRQPGSAFKPFVYAAALEAGLHPATIRRDGPIDIDGWKPGNAGGRYAGEVTLSEALARSLNTVSARLVQEVGPGKVAALARRFGVDRMPADPQPSIALGTYEVSLLDLLAAYQVFQQGGRRSEPYLIEAIQTRAGAPLYRRAKLQPIAVYDAGLNGQMVAMMQGVIDKGTGRAARLGNRPAAGKTGTSQAYRDAWFVGFTPELAAAIWLGDDRSRPMDRIGGGDLPARVWKGFMEAALEGEPLHPFDDAEATVTDGDPRNPFYAGLAADFARLRQGEMAAAAPETVEGEEGATEDGGEIVEEETLEPAQ